MDSVLYVGHLLPTTLYVLTSFPVFVMQPPNFRFNPRDISWTATCPYFSTPQKRTTAAFRQLGLFDSVTTCR